MIAAAITALFAAVVLAKSFDEFRHGREPLPVFLFWTGTWLAVLVLAFAPSITKWLGDVIFGENTGLGTIFGIGMVILLYLCYRLYLKAERTERLVNQLISDLAVRDLDAPSKE